MFPLIFPGTARKKLSCAVFMIFCENLGAQNFFAYRDFKKANNYICLCSSRMERQFFFNRLCLISTFKL